MTEKELLNSLNRRVVWNDYLKRELEYAKYITGIKKWEFSEMIYCEYRGFCINLKATENNEKKYSIFFEDFEKMCFMLKIPHDEDLRDNLLERFETPEILF